MKFLFVTVVVLLGLLIPVSAYAWQEMPEAQTDDTTFYELTYTQCAFRYASSHYSENEIECLCTQVAEHAVKWRHQVPADKLPPLSEQDEASCLYGR